MIFFNAKFLESNKSHHLFGLINAFYFFLWSYVIIGYTLTSDFHSSLVFRNAAEISFLVYMMCAIHSDESLYPKKYESLRNSNTNS